MTEKTKHFTDTIFYQIELTARYIKMLGTQLFGKLGIALTPDEFAALDCISAHTELCQRDLAKLILKGDLDREYVDKRSVTISLVHNYSNYRRVNIKVLGQRKEIIGSSVNSGRILS